MRGCGDQNPGGRKVLIGQILIAKKSSYRCGIAVTRIRAAWKVLIGQILIANKSSYRFGIAVTEFGTRRVLTGQFVSPGNVPSLRACFSVRCEPALISGVAYGCRIKRFRGDRIAVE